MRPDADPIGGNNDADVYRKEHTMENKPVCLIKPWPEVSHLVWGMPAQGKPERSQPRPLDILLVDDNPADVRIIAEGLREVLPAARLSVAKDGVEAISFLHQMGNYQNAPRPDLILLDLRLPKKSGFQVLEEIKQDPVLSSIPVVVQTSSEAAADIQKAYGLHANSYITKPHTFDEFIRSMGILVDYWVTVAKLPQGEDWKTI
jgi:chemotaxis family two-component system response regulator Rcp1